MACLAVARIKTNFQEAKSADDGCFLTTREIIAYENENYGEHISSGSYDDIRRKDLLLPVQAMIVLNSSSFDTQATNNPTRGYALNPLFADLIKYYGSFQWKENWKRIKARCGFLMKNLKEGGTWKRFQSNYHPG